MNGLKGSIHVTTHYIPAEALTIRIQDRLDELTGTRPGWDDASDAVYSALVDLARTLTAGDSIELPDGTTLQCTWKPTIRA